MNKTIGAVVISRNDGYGGDQALKLIYCLTSLLNALDEVVFVDWNSPDDVSLIEAIKSQLPQTGKLRALQVTREMASKLTNHSLDVQLCVEVMARNIGLRRMKSDYLISANGDIMCLGRDSIEAGIRDDHTFHCIARRHAIFENVLRAGSPGSAALVENMTAIMESCGQHGDGSPLGPTDPWSLISCPGDFQLAHRKVWEGIKGFEESLVMRGYADSNVQCKSAFYGFDLLLVRSIPVFHFNHYPGTGASGGTTNAGWNDMRKALMDFSGTTNPETWGFSDLEFPEQTI